MTNNFIPLAGSAASLIAAAVVVFAAARTSAAKVWREEAEAQKQRADRLAGDLTEIKNRLSALEQENRRLIQLLTSLAPNRLAGFRLAETPPED